MRTPSFLPIASLLLVPSTAWAYVDPGLIGAMYQLAYLAIAGLAATFIFRPWEYLKAKFRNRTGTPDPKLPTEDPPTGEKGERQDGNEQV